MAGSVDSALAVQEKTGKDKATEIAAANDEIAKILESVGMFDYDDCPWRDVQKDLEKTFQIKIMLDDSAIHDSLALDEPITINVTGIRIKNALTLMLNPHNATYFVRNGELVVCSLDEVERMAPKEPARQKWERLEREESDNTDVAKRLDVDFKTDLGEVPWGEVEEDIENRLGLNIIHHRSAAGVLTADDKVIAIGTGPAGDVLNKILATKKATFIVDNQVVLIVSLDSKYAEQAKELKALLATPEPQVKVAEGKIVFDYTNDWEKVKPANRLLETEMKIPRVGADKQDGRLTIMGAGGSVDANIERWEGQFNGAKAERFNYPDNVTVVHIAGTFMDAPGGPFSGKPKIERKNYRMLAAIIQTKEHGNYFVKLYGPHATISENESLFSEMIGSMKVEK
ncbi:MAG: hypothetical protein AB8B55_23160 [Mariniblastus sp.]